MKKIICFISCFVVACSCLLIPVFASSSASGINLDLPIVNHNPDYLIFDDLDVGDSGLYITFSDYNKWTTFIREDNPDRTYTCACEFWLFGLDDNFELVDITTCYVDRYVNGIYQNDRVQISNYWAPEYFYSTDSVYRFSGVLAGSHYLKYVCIVPIPGYYTSSVRDSLYDSYYWSIYNYFYAVDAYSNGVAAGASLDYNDGYQAGLEASDSGLYSSGLEDGYEVGFAAGDSAGYARGYEYGTSLAQSDASTYIKCVFDTVSAPFRAISEFLSFDILGINVLGVFAFIVTAVIIAFIVKKFI